MDFGIVFLSDVHIGSLTFLEEEFENFINWINCDFGSEEQRKVAQDIKYLIVAGDIVDGIGVYPNQDKELSIKDIRLQYDEAARFLGKIRNDIKIIIAPGNHDASRLAEPQPAIPEEYAKSLYMLDNVEFVSNPAGVSLDGINVLIYHGESFNELPMAIKGLSYEKNEQMMEELGSAIKKFAKRQMTWFRRDPRIRWLDMSKDPAAEAAGLIESFIHSES